MKTMFVLFGLALLAASLLSAGEAAAGRTLYVDGKLKESCAGTYSLAKRDASGSDGDGFATLSEASAAAKAGDTVLIREGSYHANKSKDAFDVIFPKNSGAPGQPIVFKAYKDEAVVLDTKKPDDPMPQEVTEVRCVIVLRGRSYITFENLTIKDSDGWVFARGCDHIVFKGCGFLVSHNGGKGSVKMIECHHGRFTDCRFEDSAFDSLILERSNGNVVEHCTFKSAAHCLIAIRSGNRNVIRGCDFSNPYYEGKRAEKLTEVYDTKVDVREPTDPAYAAAPAFDGTKFNLFEKNLFGYHPFRPEKGAQPSAMQYSGQNGIIRYNLYCNPKQRAADAAHPDASPGGMGICLRWGGSWEGWHEGGKGGGHWIGEGTEAGYVTGNRIFNNTFIGYDNSAILVPGEDAVKNMPNPPPVENKKDSKVFEKKYAFADNRIVNNLFVSEAYVPHIDWAWKKRIAGKPVAWTIEGLLKEVRFSHNGLFSGLGEQVVYLAAASGEVLYTVAEIEKQHPATFTGNLQKDPHFTDGTAQDFRLKPDSPMVDAGALLTVAKGAGEKSTELTVEDAGSFYDGFGIEGEQGDMLVLEGGTETARIVKIDYAKRVLTLDKPLSWKDGQGVSLPYKGKAPDIGAFELESAAPAYGVRKP
ncbi:MAG: right-handed parallel beta-helix repeat-containing protein [Planctomycetes bacterium]|nr:right-handed parallel beta-helix repeat-containing protein [Planctomycetota bacterium]